MKIQFLHLIKYLHHSIFETEGYKNKQPDSFNPYISRSPTMFSLVMRTDCFWLSRVLKEPEFLKNVLNYHY